MSRVYVYSMSAHASAMTSLLGNSPCHFPLWYPGSKVLLSETGPENGQGRILSCHQLSLRRKSTLIGQQEAQALGLVCVYFSELKVNGER